MNKFKIIYACAIILFFVLAAVVFLKIRNKEEYQQKTVLAHEIRKVLEHLMFDLREAREDSILDAPADGSWHNRVAFIQTQQGALEYIIKDGHLLRINNGKQVLIADDIHDLRIRRQKETPDLLEVRIEAQKNVSLVSNLKIRVRQ